MNLNIIKDDSWKICEVCDNEGNSPLLAWFNGLNKKYQGSVRRMLAIINTVATDRAGPTLLKKDISHEVNKNESIYEFIAGDLRLLWFYSKDERRMIVCGCQHLKKSQKANKIEVPRIIDIKKEYIASYRTGEIIYFKDGKKVERSYE
ncbi:MAG: hypothetical protein Q3M30_03805 [Candidatus Electrothrix sp. Rat3]|nr:hypothetical protein [Candidatus Electrothrix rattekaaiensis]